MSACPQLHGHRPSGPLPSEPGPGQESPSAGLPASSPAVPSTCSFRHSQSKLGKMQTLREHPQFSGKRPKPPTQPLWSTRASVVTVPSCRPELPPTALSPGHSPHPVLHKGGSVHSVFCPPPRIACLMPQRPPDPSTTKDTDTGANRLVWFRHLPAVGPWAKNSLNLSGSHFPRLLQ